MGDLVSSGARRAANQCVGFEFEGLRDEGDVLFKDLVGASYWRAEVRDCAEGTCCELSSEGLNSLDSKELEAGFECVCLSERLQDVKRSVFVHLWMPRSDASRSLEPNAVRRAGLVFAKLLESAIQTNRLRVAQQLLEELSVPYVVADRSGKVLMQSEKGSFGNESGTKESGKADKTRSQSLSLSRLAPGIVNEAITSFKKPRSNNAGNGAFYFKLIPDNSDQTAKALYVMPLGASQDAPAKAEIFAILAPVSSGLPALPVLEKVYSLTRSEADVVSKMVEGLDIAEASEALNLSKSTVRTYLKRAYSKTGVSSRAQLVARVNSVSPPFKTRA
ncbi:MAG: helix-turn-helix transcriptional regulator [Pseudomonadota bacterium]